MRKFWAYLRVGTQEALTYRAESVVWFLLEVLGLIPIISLWIYMLKHGKLNFTSTSFLVTYYFLVTIISRLTSSNFEEWVIEQIKDGYVSTVLLKPFSYSLFVFAQEITWKLFGLAYLLPTFIIIFSLFREMVIPNIHTPYIIPTVIFLVISLIQRLWFSWLISLTTFWIEQSKSLVHLKWMFEGILGGQWLPILFYPMWFQSIAKFTPFYYWYYFPISMITNRLNLNQMMIGWGIQILWLAIFYLASRILWKKAVRKYSAIGG